MKIRFNQTENPTSSTGGGAAPTAAAPASASSTPATQSSQQWGPPAGHRVVPDDVYKRFSDLETKAASLGNLDEYNPLASVLKERGMSPTQLAQLLIGKKQDKPEDAKFDPNKFREDILGEVTKRTARQQAEAAYRSRIDALPAAVKARVKSLLGDADESLADLLTEAFESKAHKARYTRERPEGDPLRGQFGADWDDALLDEVFKSYADLPAKLKGQQMKAVGDAVVRAKAASSSSGPAGNSGGNGAPPAEEGNKLFHQRSQVEQEDAIRKIAAKRGLTLA